MMADITFRQGDFEGALNLYNELLARDPSKQSFVLSAFGALVFCLVYIHTTRHIAIVSHFLSFPFTFFIFYLFTAYYLAMMRFVEAARRFGKLALVPAVLERAEKHSNRAKYEAGLSFCKGLYEWHTGLEVVQCESTGCSLRQN